MIPPKQLHAHTLPILLAAAALFVVSVAVYLHAVSMSGDNVGRALLQPVWAKPLPAGAANINAQPTLNEAQFHKAGSDTKF